MSEFVFISRSLAWGPWVFDLARFRPGDPVRLALLARPGTPGAGVPVGSSGRETPKPGGAYPHGQAQIDGCGMMGDGPRRRTGWCGFLEGNARSPLAAALIMAHDAAPRAPNPQSAFRRRGRSSPSGLRLLVTAPNVAVEGFANRNNHQIRRSFRRSEQPLWPCSCSILLLVPLVRLFVLTDHLCCSYS